MIIYEVMNWVDGFVVDIDGFVVNVVNVVFLTNL